ncbi:transmembrane protein 205 [Callorhinchus milii]|uniref:Si:ch211-121a2.4 n=1 Tax=Callorhinchus milii TaxID=7868 RepID=V9LDR1_CALMI|nr:transmembrane protein 205 [Callorhinchus milii]XP_007898017.1 transmembrane protein 205 [Callorhinchus milii]XP_007898019.1 transmembrane protein 205 [Callorhinchus milii]|eukprot:gi/632963670/ref/XP_007898016.1/ PREDICTED: transmembrane protein 205-like [Callorhinchus milii]
MMTIAMPTDEGPTTFAKLLHLIFLSTFWGMQIWVTFISEFVMGSNLSRHTFGFIRSKLFPYYFHLGSACAFFNLTIFAIYHPSELLNEEETLQIVIFFICVTVAGINAQWFGQITSEVMADMHVIEQSRGLGHDVGLSSNKEAYGQLKETNTKYKHLAHKLDLYHRFSSLCNLCCIVCNGMSLYYMAANLSTL